MHQLLGARQDLKGVAMFLFAERARQKPRARPAEKVRQGFYRKASPDGRNFFAREALYGPLFSVRFLKLLQYSQRGMAQW